MGCGSSKDAVQAIEIQNGEVRSKSASKQKKIKVVASEESIVNDSNAVIVKSTSAKSRDSGIQEMDGSGQSVNGFITEQSDPHLVNGVEHFGRPETPDFAIVGKQFHSTGKERLRSKLILEELEAQGLIQGSKLQKGGAAFEVNMAPSHLTPLAPLKKPPARLERMNSQKKIISKKDLEEKLNNAEERRNKSIEVKKSKLAMQLARDHALAKSLESDKRFSAAALPPIAPKPLDRGESGNGMKKHTIFDEGSLSSLEGDIMSFAEKNAPVDQALS